MVGDDLRYEIAEDIRKSTGVVTDWFFDWRTHLADVVAVGGYDVVVLSMGGNDGQRFAGSLGGVGSEQWEEQYRLRVQAMLRAVDEVGRLVVWVGMPAVEPPTIADLPGTVNPIAQSAVAEVARALYLDAGSFVSPDGVFVLFVADESGVERRGGVRDGVHYTIEGGRAVATGLLNLIEQSSPAT